MIRSQLQCASAAAFALIALTASRCAAVNDVAGNLIVVNDNGAWSWFEDERAIIDPNAGTAGKLIVSSVGSSAGTGGAARNGDIEVASLDLATSAITRFTLHDSLEADDHDSAALWRRPDGTYLASYSKHGSDALTRFRISTNAGDISAWSAPYNFTNAASTTYSNLHYLPNENGGNGRLYNFTRNIGFDPNVLVSYDLGATWSYGGRLLTEGGSNDRPYLRYFSDGVRVQLISTDRHPDSYDNSIYAGYVQDGKLYNSFGVEKDNILDANGLPPSTLTTIFATGTQFNGVTMRRAWTIDVAIDNASLPYVVFQARANDSDLDHRFFYGRFTGTQWNVFEVAKAGGYLYAGQYDYTGLAALDPSNPNRLFISTKIDPRTNVAMPHYEIFEGNTSNGGAAWMWEPITFNSTVDNLRPIVPKWDANHTALLWMRGIYSTYTSYDLDIVGLTAIGDLESYPLGDLNFDHNVNLSDYALYLSGLNMDLTGLSQEDAYMKGDLNGDLANNFKDFLIFRGAYDMANGAGSFAEISGSIPEPSAFLLIVLAALAGGLYRRRLGYRCVMLVAIPIAAGTLALSFSATARAIDIKVDIDSKRTSASDTSAPIVTQSGYTSWDLTNVAASGSTLTVDGIVFEIFGIVANQSRNRNDGGGGSFNNGLTDFVYNDGSAAGVGLRISNLPIGSYSLQSWHYDTSVLSGENFIQVETRTMGVAGSTQIVADMIPFSQTAIPFSLDVTAAGQVKEVVFREDDVATLTDPTDSNRSRLNAFTIANKPELTLEVNTTTGATRIVNNEGTSFDMNYYEVRSTAGSLTPANWISLDDTDAGADALGTGWDESPNSNTKLLNEIRLEQTDTLSPGQFDNLGPTFNIGGTQDLLFYYAGPNDTELRIGKVQYVSGGSGIAGDYNNNGVVDAADYALWRSGGPLQNEGRSTGVNDMDDYMFWRARFGATTNTAAGSSLVGGSVPEPGSCALSMLALSMTAASILRGQSAASRR